MPKSPYLKNDSDKPDENRNWYYGCQMATKLSKKYDWKILIPSSFEILSQGYVECAFYRQILIEMKVPEDLIITVKQGIETSSQLQVAINLAKEMGTDLMVVWSSWPHRWRYWLIKSWLEIPYEVNISHKTTFRGRARRPEFLMDILVLPILLVIKIINPFWKTPEQLFKQRLFSKLQKSRDDGKIY